jgi:hypothetical protein
MGVSGGLTAALLSSPIVFSPTVLSAIFPADQLLLYFFLVLAAGRPGKAAITHTEA